MAPYAPAVDMVEGAAWSAGVYPPVDPPAPGTGRSGSGMRLHL